MNNISYAITVCDEFVGIRKLINSLTRRINLGDEVIILVDSSSPKSEEIETWLHEFNKVTLYNIKIHTRKFDGDFAKHKNVLNSYCSCPYVVATNWSGHILHSDYVTLLNGK